MTKEEIEKTQDVNVLYSRILDLLGILASNDYKNTKNGEAERAGVSPLPYDPVALYHENQGYREEIGWCKKRIEEIETVAFINQNTPKIEIKL